MKVLVDASICSKGGGVQVALALINNIALDPAFEVICVTSEEVDAQLTSKIKFGIKHYYPEKNENIFGKKRQGKRLLNIEKKHNPDLVFVVFGPSYWRPKAKTLQGFALPLMVYPDTRNNVYKNNRIEYFYQKMLNAYKARIMRKNSDYVVVETNAFKDRVSKFLGFSDSKIFVIENSFNANFLNKKSERNSKEKLEILVPTAYYPHKNLEILVDVASNLLCSNKTHILFNFLIDEKSEHWIKIISDAKSKKVENFFNTFGPVNNTQMVDLYAKTDFVLLPTLAEASTAVYPESFISQKVLLTSNLDFAVELCGEAAVYFDPYDAKDIAEKILEIESNESKQKVLLQNGLEQVQKSYLTPESKWLKQKDLITRLVNESF
ncbi:glycosyltransferase [Acinetobacter bereziniae]|uniref:glycosyltransferase n=1 Tax=Acinetobacter bereziniae TaxID=106648 RepID=UPI00124F904C|nr:glycosyltransferase [Acinetobacter bereziniae]